METINYTWFNNSRGSIGVVLAKNDYGQQAYISAVPGQDEQSDIKLVKEWGAKLSLSQAKGFFPNNVDDESYGNT